jgi:hypothetical protein
MAARARPWIARFPALVRLARIRSSVRVSATAGLGHAAARLMSNGPTGRRISPRASAERQPVVPATPLSRAAVGHYAERGATSVSDRPASPPTTGTTLRRTRSSPAPLSLPCRPLPGACERVCDKPHTLAAEQPREQGHRPSRRPQSPTEAGVMRPALRTPLGRPERAWARRRWRRSLSRTGSITLRSRRRSARLMQRTAGPTHRSSQSVLAGPERLGGGAFPGRILVSDHRDHRGERDQRP